MDYLKSLPLGSSTIFAGSPLLPTMNVYPQIARLYASQAPNNDVEWRIGFSPLVLFILLLVVLGLAAAWVYKKLQRKNGSTH